MTEPRKWKRMWPHEEQRDLVHSVRTAIAAVGSLLIARLCKLPESYWAAITSMIVMQLTLGAALTISKQRLLGTALGAAMGALFSGYLGKNVALYGAVGLVSL